MHPFVSQDSRQHPGTLRREKEYYGPPRLKGMITVLSILYKRSPVDLTVVLTLMVAVVGLTGFARVGNISGKERCRHRSSIPAASPVNLYPMAAQLIQGSGAHVSGKHYRHAHIPQHGSDIAFTPASLRRRERLSANYIFRVVRRIYRITFAMAEMVVYATFPCRYCNFHSMNDLNYSIRLVLYPSEACIPLIWRIKNRPRICIRRIRSVYR